MVSMVTTQKGVTALYCASQEGHVTVVRLLLEKGVDVNICDKVLWTFYHVHVCGHSVSWLYVTYMYICSLQRTVCRLTTQTLLRDRN